MRITCQIACLVALIGCFVVVIPGCRTAQKNKEAEVDYSRMYGEPVPVRSVFNAQRLRGGSVKFDFTFQVPHDTANTAFNVLFHITNCYCVIIDPDLGVLDTIDLRVATGITSIDPQNDSLLVSSNGMWINPTSREFTKLIFDLVLESGNKLYHDTRILDVSASTDEEKAIAMVSVKASIDHQSDTAVTFALFAMRNRGAYMDYFPNSERLRVEIMSPKGTVLFSSAHDKMFLQEVMPVDPLKRREPLRYTYEWDGRMNDGSILPSGEYPVRLSLPAKPEAYTDSLTLRWQAREP